MGFPNETLSLSFPDVERIFKVNYNLLNSSSGTAVFKIKSQMNNYVTVLGFEIEWENESNTISITDPKQTQYFYAI